MSSSSEQERALGTLFQQQVSDFLDTLLLEEEDALLVSSRLSSLLSLMPSSWTCSAPPSLPDLLAYWRKALAEPAESRVRELLEESAETLITRLSSFLFSHFQTALLQQQSAWLYEGMEEAEMPSLEPEPARAENDKGSASSTSSPSSPLSSSSSSSSSSREQQSRGSTTSSSSSSIPSPSSSSSSSLDASVNEEGDDDEVVIESMVSNTRAHRPVKRKRDDMKRESHDESQISPIPRAPPAFSSSSYRATPPTSSSSSHELHVPSALDVARSIKLLASLQHSHHQPESSPSISTLISPSSALTSAESNSRAHEPPKKISAQEMASMIAKRMHDRLQQPAPSSRDASVSSAANESQQEKISSHEEKSSAHHEHSNVQQQQQQHSRAPQRDAQEELEEKKRTLALRKQKLTDYMQMKQKFDKLSPMMSEQTRSEMEATLKKMKSSIA